MIFTQFHLPFGRSTDEQIDVSPATERIASILLQRGYRFEIELLRTGEVHLDCCNNEHQLWNIIRPNGPGMREAVEQLVAQAYAELMRGGWKASGLLRGESE